MVITVLACILSYNYSEGGEGAFAARGLAYLVRSGSLTPVFTAFAGPMYDLK